MWKLNPATLAVQWWNTTTNEWILPENMWRMPTPEEVTRALNEWQEQGQGLGQVQGPQQAPTIQVRIPQAMEVAIPEFTPDPDEDDDDGDELDMPERIEQEPKVKTELEKKEYALDLQIMGLRQGGEHARYGGKPYDRATLENMATGTKEERTMYAEAWERGYKAAVEKEKERKTQVKKTVKKKTSWESAATSAMKMLGKKNIPTW